MNFLAHLYLSGSNQKLLTGNFIGDYVKGKNFLNYPGKISEGIILHRRIDSFTDNHNLFKNTKILFRPDFGHYSGVVSDLIFDHFLANNWESYHHLSLSSFSHWVENTLLDNFFYLPPRVRKFLPRFIKAKRLESYASLEGMYQSLDLMSHYTSLPSKASEAINILEKNYNFIGKNFTQFMEEIITFVKKEGGVKFNKKI